MFFLRGWRIFQNQRFISLPKWIKAANKNYSNFMYTAKVCSVLVTSHCYPGASKKRPDIYMARFNLIIPTQAEAAALSTPPCIVILCAKTAYQQWSSCIISFWETCHPRDIAVILKLLMSPSTSFFLNEETLQGIMAAKNCGHLVACASS